jgi:Domain of unknown function (DUF3576)
MMRNRRWSTVALAAVLALGLGVSACGSNPDREEANAAGDQIGVNSFLWRAALDTLSFMPMTSADSVGGTIITDWYSNPEAPRERFKATVYILDTRLRADGLKVAINRQTLTANGWQDAPSDPDVGIQIENRILVRARELRLSTLQN